MNIRAELALNRERMQKEATIANQEWDIPKKPDKRWNKQTEILQKMVRDFTTAIPKSKSEVRKRINEYGSLKYKEGVMFGSAVRDDSKYE